MRRGRTPEPRGAGATGGAVDRGADRARSASASDLGGEQVEGRRAVRELLRAGRRRVLELWLAEGREDAPVLAEIEGLALTAGVPVHRVGIGRLAAAARTSAPQGVIAYAAPLPELDLDDLVMSGDGGPPFLVVLDGVTDPHNVGAVMRAAECAGATGVVLGRHRAAHVNATVAKVAAGAVEHLPIALVAGVPSALSELGRLGVWTVGLAADGDTDLFGLQLASSPVALVLGSEGQGLSRLARARCDVVARIPLGGQVESLNVATAAAVACFEVLRQRTSRA